MQNPGPAVLVDISVIEQFQEGFQKENHQEEKESGAGAEKKKSQETGEKGIQQYFQGVDEGFEMEPQFTPPGHAVKETGNGCVGVDVGDPHIVGVDGKPACPVGHSHDKIFGQVIQKMTETADPVQSGSLQEHGFAYNQLLTE